jgi:hypothetical protein
MPAFHRAGSAQVQGSERQRAAPAPEPRGQPLAIGCRPEQGSLPPPAPSLGAKTHAFPRMLSAGGSGHPAGRTREAARSPLPGRETKSVCFPGCSRWSGGRAGGGRTRLDSRRFSKTRQEYAQGSRGAFRERPSSGRPHPPPRQKDRSNSRRHTRAETVGFVSSRGGMIRCPLGGF